MDMKKLHDGEYCLECGAMATDEHHCFPGPNRKNADEDGLTVRLCRRCHSRLHDKDNRLEIKYKKLAQIAYEYRYSHEEFMNRYGRNYL